MENLKAMGNKLVHEVYGEGTIKNVEKTEDGYMVTVDFDEVGEEKLLSFINPLEK